MEAKQYLQSTLEQLGCPGLVPWSDIRDAYHGRPYHNVDHLNEMLAGLAARLPPGTSAAPRDPAIFGFALLYHDIVYRAHRSDNEARSARRALATLERAGNVAENRMRRCHRLIMATKDHRPSDRDNGDEALLIDLDLGVLARSPSGYDDYAAAVRREFSLYPDFLYRPGRAKALKDFLRRPFIYHTDFGREQLEASARKNIERELSGL